jgi:hypothetical protein
MLDVAGSETRQIMANIQQHQAYYAYPPPFASLLMLLFQRICITSRFFIVVLYENSRHFLLF